MRRLQAHYTEDWKPIDLTDATVRGEVLSLQTFVTSTTAQTHLRNGQATDTTDTIAADAVLLVNALGTFEALAHKVGTCAAGATIPAYSAPIRSRSGPASRLPSGFRQRPPSKRADA